ncbi:pantoate--beta-alanine ligase [Paenibacillus sp. GXUN7292]|uniref:pantoate--beta-alanine ligase n=1 Tax=Paenibacillus sp. GXUN7292 TaxID=3422499 RepID=UPI003D7E84FD
MMICRTIKDLKSHLNDLRESDKTVGFVPTMGFLHEGHASLMRAAREQNQIVVLSIFVNPMQFGPNEDLDRYPRNEERDIELAAACGVDLVFLPSVEEMYPKKPLTSIKIAQITDQLCGASRPGHFDGVGLVVSKLFHIVNPSRAYFGMKDAQQVAVIEQLVHDLNMDVEIVKCPIVREPDGLALSSRNVYLTAEQRIEAVALSQAMRMATELYEQDGAATGQLLLQKVTARINKEPLAKIDYVQLLAYPELEQIDLTQKLSDNDKELLLAVAVYFGKTRLIDNSLLVPVEVMTHV